MRLLRVLRQRARSLFRRERADAELGREIAFHLEALTRENIEAGMSEPEARLAARRALGGVAAIEEECRDHRRVGWLTDLGKDISYAGRQLRKSPGFTALAVAALALGAGGSIALYAIAEALLLRTLPYPAPDRLVVIASVHVRQGKSGIGQEDFRDWRASNTVFEHMTFSEFSQVTLAGQGEAERITGTAVSPGYFETFAVAPELGRWFTPDEQRPGGERVVILSHRLWARKFGSRPDVVGSSVLGDGIPIRVVGVMPERFGAGAGSEYWTTIRYVNYGRQNHQYSCYARLKPGVRLRAAQAQMAGIARRNEKIYPDCAGWGISVQSMRGALLDNYGPALGVFGAAAGFVLVIACANIASLLLARGVGRAKEIAVRMALGAGRRRVVRLLLMESLLLSSLGVLVGAALSWWLIRAAVVAVPGLRLDDLVSVSPSLAAFILALTLAIGVFTGLWPALRNSRADLQASLKDGGAAVVSGGRPMRSAVVVEMALAVALLVFAGLLVESFVHLLRVDLGFRPDGLLTFRMSLPRAHYRDDASRARFCDSLLARLGAIPGVVSVSASDSVPLGGTFGGSVMTVEGQPASRDWADVMVRGATVTPDYFRTLGTPLLAGRVFTAADTAGAEPVLVVNEAFVRKLIPNGAAVGIRAREGQSEWRRIVGVVADARYQGPASEVPAEAYVPFAQSVYFSFVALRMAVPESAVLPAVRETIRSLDSQLAITQVRTMRESLALATTLQRNLMRLVCGFAAVALAMSTLGLAGVMAFTVSRRRREIGLRMALGAQHGDIAREVMLGAARLVVVGLLLGTAAAFAGARLLESMLYGVRPNDPLALAAAPVALAAVALAASFIPARQAASVDPMSALRQE